MRNNNTNIQLENLFKGIDIISGPINSAVLFDLVDRVSLEIQTKVPFDLFVVWTDPPRKMICLEPWTSPRNSLITGDRAMGLLPGSIEELECKFIVNNFS